MDERQIRALIAAAERAEAAGQPQEAVRLLDQARAAAPDHLLVLGAIGLRLLRAGDAAAARPLLERAAGAADAGAVQWLNLALAHDALRDEQAERAALDEALALEPRFHLALLQKARLLERQGRTKQAAFHYHAFLCCLPPGAKQPPAMQATIAHARQAVAANDASLHAFVSERIAATRARYAGERLERFDDCLDVLVGRKRVYVHQPTFMNFPYLPAIQFYEPAGFPWVAELEAATEEIRAELLEALARDEGFVPYVSRPADAPLDQWQELNESRRWSSYFLYKAGAPVAEHLARCPHTAAALARILLADVPGHGPVAFFSQLAPKTRIPAHTGVTNTRLIVHLPLIVPPGCRYRVGNAVREWQPGRVLIFDDSIEHEAWNDGDEPRTVLIFDIWNPALTEAERDLVRATTEACQLYYGGEAPFAGA